MENNEINNEQELVEFEGYHDSKSIIKAASELIEVYPELADDIDELVTCANDTNTTLRNACVVKYAKGSFTNEDEEAYRSFKRKNPTWTRNDYVERIMNRDEYLERIQREMRNK